MKKTSLLFAATLLATPAFAQNDECTGAVALVDGAATAYDTTTATTSLPAWPCALGGSDIWYSFTTTQLADVEVSTCGSGYDTAIEIFSGDCNNLVSVTCNDDFCGLQSTATAMMVPSGTNLLIRVGGFNGGSGTGTVTLTETAPFDCSTSPDDSFEDNDVCTSASTITAGNYTNLFASTTDADFYEVALGANDILDFIIFDTPAEDLDLNLYDSSCNLIQFFNTDGLSYAAGGVAQTVIVEVFLDPGFSGIGCLNYDADISISPDPCSVLQPDSFEENDDCTTAVAINDGTFPGLTVFDTDNDYFSLTVPNGGTLDASILFSNANGDTDLYLWDPLVECDTNVAGTGGAYLVRGFSATDDEVITYTNNTGADQNLILEVDMFTTGGCNSYDLIVSGAGMGGPGPIGSNYCMQEVNATGVVGTMSGFGQTSIAANDITITASNLPLNQFGIFVCSDTQGFVPFAGGTSNGNICLGGVIGRYQSAGQILSSGATGTYSLTINVNTIPQGGGILAVSAGLGVNFQSWHREGIGAGSCFTDGLEIVLSN